MKHINILSLCQASDTLEGLDYSNFLDFYGIKIKDEEINDLKTFTQVLIAESDICNNLGFLNQFYIGYKIPQVGKEFDLLRFGEDIIINIEIKRESTKEKILKQLIRNKYYLSYLGKTLYHLTFISSTSKIYYLNDKDKICEIDIKSLVELLEKQQLIDLNYESIDDFFNPSDYLVSPFNSTNKFIKGKYFLTQHQEEVKNKTFTVLKNTSVANYISITGSAGTGKTLLIYDIAKKMIELDKKVVIFHCGYLNEGQIKLNTKYDWDITPIKNYINYNLSEYDLVILDETQRIYPKQLDLIITSIEQSKGNCILSYDKLQTLRLNEERNNIDKKINEIIGLVSYRLSEKIRTNKEISSFIKLLFNKDRIIQGVSKKNIKLNYFNNVTDARDFLETQALEGWNVIRFTPSQYNNEHHEKYSLLTSNTSHGVIGQEFDNVTISIDEYFKYNEKGSLTYSGRAYYHPVKMLFQNITRTRKQLNIVIINNTEILDRCISILK